MFDQLDPHIAQNIAPVVITFFLLYFLSKLYKTL